VVTLGMRGDGDEPMTQGTAIELLQTIVADQRTILADLTGKPPERTPQVWALYKEVQDYFDDGMKVPDDVTLLFADDNWGNIRRLPKPGQTRGGGYGVYYHFDYVGGPRNYKWLNTTQIERTWEQMHLAYEYGARQLWIVNVGDLKPMEFPISFFLDHAWKPEAFGIDELARYPAQWAAEQFGPANAHEIGELLTRYTQYNARRKPELLSPDTFSLVDDHEADRVVADWNTLVERARNVAATLAPQYRDAYYQLVEYPITASANLTAMYVATGRNRLYAKQGRASANAQADLARTLFERDAELARVYERDIAGGKWIHMMSQPRIGYTGWQQPDRNILPALERVSPTPVASMGVALEGSAAAWPGATSAATLPALNALSAPSRTITLFNRGTKPFGFQSEVSQPWLRVSPASGTVSEETSLRVDIDWNVVPANARTARVTLRGDEGTRVVVDVPLERLAPGARGFVETDGRIAIEAAHYDRAQAGGGVQWRTIPNLGRTLSGVGTFPVTAPPGTTDERGAWLEYPIHLARDGEFDVRVVISPTLDFQHRGGLRYAVSIDGQAPRIVTVKSDPTPGHADFNAWTRAVSDSVYVGTSRHRAKAGNRTLRIWRVDPGVVLQRVEVARDGARASYLGAPESPKS